MINKRKKVIIFVLIIITGVLLVTLYYTNKAQVYNKTVTAANKAVATEEYDKAITLYTEAKKYKKGNDIDNKIELCNQLKISKLNYETAIEKTTDKDYLGGIDSFKKVDKQDTKRYSVAQSKVSECIKLYIATNLKSANDNLVSSKFDEANKYLDNILKLDVNNADAKKAKDNVAKAIQKQKNDAIVAQVAAKAKEEEADKVKITNSKIKELQKSIIGTWGESGAYNMIITEQSISGKPYNIIYDESNVENNNIVIEVTDEYGKSKYRIQLENDNTIMMWLYNEVNKYYSGGSGYGRIN